MIHSERIPRSTRFLTALMALLVLWTGPGIELCQGAPNSLPNCWRGQPDTGFAGGIIDIMSHNGGIWLATDRGLNFSQDGGHIWLLYDSTNGLVGNSISAMFSTEDRLWVASSHHESVEDSLSPLSDGLTYSDDDGETWTTIDFGPGGLNIPYVTGSYRTIYDITGHRDVGFLNHRADDTTDWLFASAFAGGLLVSQDDGLNWRRIFASRADSVQYSYTPEAPSLRNRLFSCAVDTSHGDSLFLWAGTAAGTFQHVFAPPRAKLYSHRINSVAFCDTCSSGNGSRLFAGGDNGLSFGSATEGTFASRFEVDGLPGREVSALVSIGDKVLAGAVDPSTGASTGLAVSTDQGESWAEVHDLWVGADSVVSGFAIMNGRVYAAVQQAGLFVSTDSGMTWSDVPLDAWYSNQTLLTTNALSVFDDTLLVGTDSGLVALTLDSDGAIVDASHQPFYDTDTTSARIVRARIQWFENETLPGTCDSAVVWTVNRPLGPSGVPMVARRAVSGEWTSFRHGIGVYDINFFGDTVFAVGENGIWFSPTGEEPTAFFSARQLSDDTLLVDNLDNDTVTVMEVRADTVVFGCFNGVAISHNRGESFSIYRANTDTLSADFVVNYSYLNSLGGLAGDFIPALGVQYRSAGPARVWAGCRATGMGGDGISVGKYDSTGVMKWQTAYQNDFAWNFTFNGDTVFAATNQGVVFKDMSGPDSLTPESGWNTIVTSSLRPGQPMYAVRVIGSSLWVAGGNTLAELSLFDLAEAGVWTDVVEDAEAQSAMSLELTQNYPNPFNSSTNIQFTLAHTAHVTLDMFNIVGRKVATIIDARLPVGPHTAVWNGTDANGRPVASGVYLYHLRAGEFVESKKMILLK